MNIEILLMIICIFLLCFVVWLKKENQKLKKREKHLKKKANTDSLTQIYNRASVEFLVNDFLQGEEAKEGIHGLFLIDVDNFKQINDTYGHGVGDQVLMKLAKTLKEKFRKSDIVGRMGGDEFLVFVKSMKDKRQILSYGNNIVGQMEHVSKEIGIEVTISIGLCTKPKAKFQDMYLAADKALYEAKKEGKNVCVMYKE